LENVATAQPGVNLFPSATDYKAGYNGILRVGIAFSMWLATGIELVFTKRNCYYNPCEQEEEGCRSCNTPPPSCWLVRANSACEIER